MRVALSARRMRFFVVGLLVTTVGLASAAPAQGYRRLSNLLISSPDGGTLDVCRDGVRFQVFASTAEGETPDPPGVQVDYAAYSPAPPLGTEPPYVDPATPNVAAGRLTLERQAVPFDAQPGDGNVEWDLVTHTTRWNGGQLLPAGASVYLDLFSSAPNVPWYVDADCLLFPPPVDPPDPPKTEDPPPDGGDPDPTGPAEEPPGLTRRKAMSRAKTALARRFGKAFRRRKGYTASCSETSDSRHWSCRVRWTYKHYVYKGKLRLTVRQSGLVSTRILIRRKAG